MVDEINFSDLLALKKISADTIVEKFGSTINSSFFDAANILGSLKIKGLVDYGTNTPGQNVISITDVGNKLLGDADIRSKESIDNLDMEIIHQLGAGKRELSDVSNSINVSQTDLAMHLNKLLVNGYADASFRNGVVNINLTDKGFNLEKEPPASNEEKNNVPSSEPAPEAKEGELMVEPEDDSAKYVAEAENAQAPEEVPKREEQQPSVPNSTPQAAVNASGVSAPVATANPGTGKEEVKEMDDLKSINGKLQSNDEEIETELKSHLTKKSKKPAVAIAVVVILIIIVVVLKVKGVI
ncbi:putative membrane-associated trancriptional regulator [Candidatus Mancarchaeum acidiphilum]|uniref:Putative membrane-associated trancriptional regulator n=1 Tax=Candidatus Mancarchaeum acidiphilum TaxID=1920749 RepID=A0A218NNZ3_9ARCH|nr:hypothetical protein [Candidatus Mancarchaeum acidiphilum]ASI14200.1 putative membrane-associated trancriptional regulator [Candidatus Mancarchaeum acidiphilum]